MVMAGSSLPDDAAPNTLAAAFESHRGSLCNWWVG